MIERREPYVIGVGAGVQAPAVPWVVRPIPPETPSDRVVRLAIELRQCVAAEAEMPCREALDDLLSKQDELCAAVDALVAGRVDDDDGVDPRF